MRKLGMMLVLGSWLSALCFAQYFPDRSLDRRGDSFKAHWYTCHLQALGEPSLFVLSKDPRAEAYRFVWLRSFHHPVVVRISRMMDGSFELISKVADGAGGYAPGKIVSKTARTLNADEAQKLLSSLDRARFWGAPNPINDQRGTDGSQWIIEGVKSGRYHVIDRWSPHAGPAYVLGLLMAFELGKLDVPEDERY